MKMVLQMANHPEGTVVAYLKATKEMLVIYDGYHFKYCVGKAAISSLRIFRGIFRGIFRSNKSKYSVKTSDKIGGELIMMIKMVS